LRDEEDFARHCDYIHYNPVKHGRVDCPGDWPYSSFRRFVEAGDYEPEWGRTGSPPAFAGLDETAME
jgi:putative transposase